MCINDNERCKRNDTDGVYIVLIMVSSLCDITLWDVAYI